MISCHTEVEPAVTAGGKTWFSYIIYSCKKVTLVVMIQDFRPLWSLPLPSVCLPFINMYKCVFLHTNSVPSSILIKCLVTAFLHINLLMSSRYRVFSHDVTAAILVKTMKTMKRRPCWCPKPILWELNSFLMQTLSFVPINLHRY